MGLSMIGVTSDAGISLKYRTLLSGFLVVGFLYCLVPTESSEAGFNLSVYVRFVVATAITLLVMVLYRPRIEKASARCLLFFIVFSLLAAVVSFSNSFFLFFASVIFGVTLATACKKKSEFRKALSAAVFCLLVISIISLAVQIIIYISQGVLIDVHKILYPFSEARIPDQGFFLRFGGIHIEPGTYSQWTYLLLLIYLAINRDVRAGLVLSVAASMILTASTWGCGVAVFMIVVSSFSRVRQSLLVVIGAFVLIIILYRVAPIADVFDFFDSKLTFETETAGAKNDIYAEFLAIIGDITVVGLGFQPKFCLNCYSPQDAGLAVSLSVTMGLAFSIGIFGFYFSFLLRAGEFKFAAMSLPLLLTKAFVWDFSVWLLFFLVVARCRARKDLAKLQPTKVGEIEPSQRVLTPSSPLHLPQQRKSPKAWLTRA